MSSRSDEMEQLYEINDWLTALASRYSVPFKSEDEEDEMLNELTHHVAEKLRIGPYRIRRVEE